ncbi:enoyl-CoA hydratase/isomerase family protein [Alcaligenaceae bacterium CGII-47]|nr:enoyl-CoA hydratase/isomerase family protein [Alcaligenaceae bacterium CGII-47]
MSFDSRYDKYERLVFDWPAEHVLRVTMNRPERMNAADRTMHRELAEVWRDIDSDQRVCAVILRGAGKAFSAGGDMEMCEALTNEEDYHLTGWKEARDIVYNVINCSKPIVSAIHGAAVGAGLAAGILADVSIVANNARIIDGHTKLGVAAGDHSAIIWPLLCGMAKAKYYLLSCETLSGAEAERIGLVSMAVDESELQQKAEEVALRLASLAPSAVRFTKYALNNWLRQAGPIFDASLALEWMGWKGPDVQEGIRSFREKRPAQFDPSSPL